MKLTRRMASSAGAIPSIESGNQVLRRVQECCLLAHRGYAGIATENTISAIRSAAPTADAIELDVRLSADAIPVVIHDSDLHRLVGNEGSVGAFDASELSSMDVLGSAEGIPDLRTYVEAVPAGVGLNVEIKEPAAVQPAIDVLRGFNRPILLSSFDADVLALADDLAPSFPLAYLVGTDAEPDAVATAIELSCVAVHPSRARCLRTRVIARAHAADLRVNVWTVRRRSIAWCLASLGVDGVIADRPVLPGVRRGYRKQTWLGNQGDETAGDASLSEAPTDPS